MNLKTMLILLILLFIVVITACSNNRNNNNENIINENNKDNNNYLNYNQNQIVEISKEVKQMKITSPAFENNANIPLKYTCDGEDINPQLNIEKIPNETKSLVLIVDDPDAPMGTWVHWVVINIQPDKNIIIEENSVPGKQLMNNFKRTSYGGPCPPSGTHRYFFKVYALDTELNLDESKEKADVEDAMNNHIIAQAQLIGLYSKR